MEPYSTFLASKQAIATPSGFVADSISPQLFEFQREITRWALERGRAAVFADCGLGKTPIQLEWANQVAHQSKRPVLILAPLAVAQQTVREGKKFGIPVHYCRSQDLSQGGVNVTNYEMLARFSPEYWGGIVLDESSILKSYSGSTRQEITQFASAVDYRLACTATPAPNDLIEIINHAEFLGAMGGKEIIALFFTQDGNTTHKWRLKGHAKKDFWKWLASWAVAIRKPSDLGFPDSDFVLPELIMHRSEVSSSPLEGMLFPVDAQTLDERRQARRDSIKDRVAAVADLVNGSGEQWLIWCDLNAESDALRRAIPDSVEVKGSDSIETKETVPVSFTNGEVRVLISKPSIFGFGLNFQHCNHVAFVGLSDSYEQFYQAIRRCWRFGQKKPVQCHVITAEAEGAVVTNIKRKEKEATAMMDSIVKEMSTQQCGQLHRNVMTYAEAAERGSNWEMRLGDSIEVIKSIPENSIGLTLFSPPFPGMYAYTNSPRDVGNSTDINEMMGHFRFLVPDLLRVTEPGRMCCVHLMQLTAMKSRDGYIGVKDYRGAVIQEMTGSGWVYAGEVTIDKNPQIQAVRNKERGLLFKTLAKDSSLMRMALADYLIYFRKPGENKRPIHAGISKRYNASGGWITEKEWIEWAAPVWYRQVKGLPGGIRETDVLNVRQARETDDERHLCPLQLGVIERAVKLWSAPGDTVFSPFAGIGSEGYVSIQKGRRFIGIELKESYYKQACANLQRAEKETPRDALFATA